MEDQPIDYVDVHSTIQESLQQDPKPLHGLLLTLSVQRLLVLFRSAFKMVSLTIHTEA